MEMVAVARGLTPVGAETPAVAAEETLVVEETLAVAETLAEVEVEVGAAVAAQPR